MLDTVISMPVFVKSQIDAHPTTPPGVRSLQRTLQPSDQGMTQLKDNVATLLVVLVIAQMQWIVNWGTESPTKALLGQRNFTIFSVENLTNL